MDQDMGLKAITELVHIGESVTQTVLNTAATEEISIPLSPVDRQVSVVTDVLITSDTPEPVPATRSTLIVTVSKTNTGTANINNSDVISQKRMTCYGGAAEFSAVLDDIGNMQNSTGGKRDYLMIIATENAFITVDSTNAAAQLSDAQCRITGYFASADVSTYNALILSELQQ